MRTNTTSMRQKMGGLKKTTAKLAGIKSFILKHKGKIALMVLALLFVVGFTRSRANAQNDTQPVGTPVDINESAQLTALNQEEQRLNQKFDVMITSAQRQKRVLVRGQWLKAREGKLFLVINMDIKNNVQVPMYALPQDWLRLVKEEGKNIAPTTHQGLVEVRPLSTKVSNVAFVIDENEKDFTIQVGSIDKLDTSFNVQF